MKVYHWLAVAAGLAAAVLIHFGGGGDAAATPTPPLGIDLSSRVPTPPMRVELRMTPPAGAQYLAAVRDTTTGRCFVQVDGGWYEMACAELESLPKAAFRVKE